LQNGSFATRPSPKAAFGAKTTSQISRHRRETAAFSGFCKPEDRSAGGFFSILRARPFSASQGERLARFFLQAGRRFGRSVPFCGRAFGFSRLGAGMGHRLSGLGKTDVKGRVEGIEIFLIQVILGDTQRFAEADGMEWMRRQIFQVMVMRSEKA
jgi:hypothetical protein